MQFIGHRGLSGGQMLSSFQWELVLFSLVVAAFALVGSFIYAMVTRTEVSKKYRASTVANALISGIAVLGYLILIVYWNLGYHYTGTGFTPSASHFFGTSLRYVDWAVTVPLLCAEFLAVAGQAGPRTLRTRAIMMGSAFAMIVTGFIGQALNEDSSPNLPAFAIWGAISTVFFLVLVAGFLGGVRSSRATMGPESFTNLRSATLMLMGLFCVYPAVYIIFGFTRSDAYWAVTAQLLFCGADIAAKAGFGAWIHKVAKLRTAEDTTGGEMAVSDTFPQEVFVDQVQLSRPAQANAIPGMLTTANAPGGPRAGNGRSDIDGR